MLLHRDKDKIIENTAIFFSSVAVRQLSISFGTAPFCKVFFYIFLTCFFLIFNLIHIYYAISMTRLQYLIPLYLKKIIFSTAKCSAFPSVKKERALNTLSFAILIYLFFFTYKNTICTHISTIRTDFFHAHFFLFQLPQNNLLPSDSSIIFWKFQYISFFHPVLCNFL